ncbi:MAG: gamma-glutamyltransferase [Alphaproteobacteria bacterium]
MKRLIFVLFVLALAGGAQAEEIATRHMIVAAEPYASEAGLEMLRAGGSAVDAAIAAQLVLTLVEPQSSGIGGGGYLLVAEPNGTLHAYDGREIAPASAEPAMFLDAQGKPRPRADAIPGGLSVGIPGNIALLARAHERHGKLPWAILFEPAVRLADQGFKVPARMAAELRYPENASASELAKFFSRADGKLIEAGDIWHNREYARTLREIAKGGREAFYKGRIADAIIERVKTSPRNPAVITREDFAAYRVIDREAICGTYRLYHVCSVPPSTSGGITLLQILGMLERFPSSELEPGTLKAVHLLTQAERLAFADRARWIGDPDFVQVPLPGLIDKNYLSGRAKHINVNRDMDLASAGTPPSERLIDYAPIPQARPGGTSHLDAVDGRGQVVSLTASVESVYGAKLVAAGFVLNNELTDFTFVPQAGGRPVANAPAPRKRPMSAMTPTIVFGPGGKFFAAIGSPGGSRIIGYVAQAVSALIDAHVDMQAAIGAPHYLNRNGVTELETGTAIEALAPKLVAMGHQVRAVKMESGLNGIRRVPEGYEGASDPRRSGAALGD